MVFKQKLEKFTRAIIPWGMDQKSAANESVRTYKLPI